MAKTFAGNLLRFMFPVAVGLPSIPKDIKHTINQKFPQTVDQTPDTEPGSSFGGGNDFAAMLQGIFSSPEAMEMMGGLFENMMGGQGSTSVDPNNPMYRGQVDQGFGNNNFSFKDGGTPKRFPFGGYTPTLYNNANPVRSFDTNFGQGNSASSGGGSNAFNAGNMHPTNVPPVFSGQQDTPVNTGLPNNPYTELFRMLGTQQRQYLPHNAEYGGQPSLFPTKAPYEEFAPAQTEPNEAIIFPDYSIALTKSIKTHKDMEKDEITDIVPGDAYIVSDKTILKRKDLEVSFGYLPTRYQEDDTTKEPLVELRLDSILKDKEDEISVFEATQRVKKMYPVSDRHNDLFAKVTAMENRNNRALWLDMIKELSEKNKVKHFTRGGQVQHFPWGAIASAAGSLVGPIFDFFSSKAQRKDAKKKEAEREVMFNDVFNQQEGNLQMGSLSTLMSIMNNNPNVIAPDRAQQMTTLRGRDNRIPEEYINSLVSRTRAGNNQLIDSVFRNSGNSGRAYSYAADATGRAENRIQDSLREFVLKNIDLKNSNLVDEANLMGISATEEANAKNATVANQNKQISSAGAVGSNFFTQLNNLLANRTTNTLISQGLGTAQSNSASDAMTQSLYNFGAGLAGIQFDNPDPTSKTKIGNNNSTTRPPADDSYEAWLKSLGL